MREEQEQKEAEGRGRRSRRWRMWGYPRDFCYETDQNMKKTERKKAL